MSTDWYIKINNAEHGPLSSDKLKQLAQQGKVTPDTSVKKGQAGTWHRANDVHGLFTTGNSHSAPAMAALPPKPASSAPTPTPSPPRVVPPALPQTAASLPASQPPDILESPRLSARSSTSSSLGRAAPGRLSPASHGNTTSAPWYLCEEGKTFGPYSDAELKEMARDGAVGPAAQVKEGELGNRMSASRVPGIAFPTAQPQAENAIGVPLPLEAEIAPSRPAAQVGPGSPGRRLPGPHAATWRPVAATWPRGGRVELWNWHQPSYTPFLALGSGTSAVVSCPPSPLSTKMLA
jgi:hypothetical protein